MNMTGPYVAASCTPCSSWARSHRPEALAGPELVAVDPGPRRQRSRSASSTSPISRLTNRTPLFNSQRTCSQMFRAKSRLAHGRPGGQDDELIVPWKPLVISSRSMIAGGHPGDGVAVGGLGLDPVHRRDDHVLDVHRSRRSPDPRRWRRSSARPPPGARRPRSCSSSRRGGSGWRDSINCAADGLLLDDLGVILGVGGVGDAVDDLRPASRRRRRRRTRHGGTNSSLSVMRSTALPEVVQVADRRKGSSGGCRGRSPRP